MQILRHVAAGEIEGDQLREGGGGGHGDMDARGRAGVKSRGRLAFVSRRSGDRRVMRTLRHGADLELDAVAR